MTMTSALYALLLLPALSLSRPEVITRTPNGFHLPIYRRELSRINRRAGGASGSIGLGDFRDITYNVLVQMGGTQMPLVLDTGSSDLWVISDACNGGSCAAGVTLYPQASFQSANLDVRLFYGDSETGTHAFGVIGKDTVSVAGLAIQDQYFAAINDTNTTVVDTASAGIFGLGFPVNSVIWHQLFRAQFPNDPPPPTKRSNTPSSSINDLQYTSDLRRTRFPDLSALLPTHSTSKRQVPIAASPLTHLLETFATNGPLIARFAALGALAAPQFTVTLQRDTLQLGGSTGLLSVGELPEGVSNESLTWVPLRGYTPQQGGIDAPEDIFPIAWEVPIDDVFLDGTRLPRSTLTPNVSVTALIDTGSSLVRGPRDVVQALQAALSPGTTYDCTVPHTLEFQIGGKFFAVDPRDFPTQAPRSSVKDCSPNVAPTDPPRNGFLYSWSLGDPFLKSNMAVFYYGNLTHPSVDPPRMGFMSMIPNDAGEQLKGAVAAAQASGSFPSKTDAPPPSDPAHVTTVSGISPTIQTSPPSSDGANRMPTSGSTTTGVSWTVLGAAASMAVGAWAW